MYESGSTMIEMIDILKNMGFDLVAINPVFSDPMSGYLLQADGIFINTNLFYIINCNYFINLSLNKVNFITY